LLIVFTTAVNTDELMSLVIRPVTSLGIRWGEEFSERARIF